MKRALVFSIRLYQRFLSPLLLPACRYVPTCSHYAAEAVEIHGPAKGVLLAAWRLLRCHPFARGGFDPVPSACPAHTRVAPAPRLRRATERLSRVAANEKSPAVQRRDWPSARSAPKNVAHGVSRG